MVDDQQAEQSVVTETPPSPVPSEEQKTPESSVGQQDAPQEVSADQKPVEEGLPTEAKDRTKREFEKLQRQLREERMARERLESRFRSMQPKAPELPPVYDPETGLLNEQALSQRDRLTQEALNRAARAEEAVQNYEKDREERETFSAYPELDPNERFGKPHDVEFHKEVRRIALDSMLNPQDYGDKQLSFKEAADLAKGRLTPQVEAAKQQGAKEAIEQLTPKEQASLEATGSSGRRTQVNNLDDLRRRSRKGDSDAIIERLKALG